MVSNAPPAAIDDSTSDRDSSTVLNALVGGVAGVVLSFVPLSPVLGGAIAGYLEDGTPRDGLRVGAIAGLVMLIPFAFFGTVLLFFLLGFAGPAAFGLLGIFVLLAAAIYTVGLSTFGGYLGVYLKDDL